METFHKRVLLPLMVLFLVLTTVNIVSAQVPDGIISSLKTGNAKVLASYFNQNVELVILDNDNVYSKAQAEQILSEFFSRYKPEKFTIIHQGGKEGAQYVIGNLVTVVGNMTAKQEIFRVYFLLKKSADKDIIHQLRIEKQG